MEAEAVVPRISLSVSPVSPLVLENNRDATCGSRTSGSCWIGKTLVCLIGGDSTGAGGGDGGGGGEVVGLEARGTRWRRRLRYFVLRFFGLDLGINYYTYSLCFSKETTKTITFLVKKKLW